MAVEVETRASRHQNPLALRATVVGTFQEAAPGSVLVDLVEDPHRCDGKLSLQDLLAVLRRFLRAQPDGVVGKIGLEGAVRVENVQEREEGNLRVALDPFETALNISAASSAS